MYCPYLRPTPTLIHRTTLPRDSCNKNILTNNLLSNIHIVVRLWVIKVHSTILRPISQQLSSMPTNIDVYKVSRCLKQYSSISICYTHDILNSYCSSIIFGAKAIIKMPM